MIFNNTVRARGSALPVDRGVAGRPQTGDSLPHRTSGAGHVERLVYGPFHGGRWRHYAGTLTVSCDVPGCTATVEPRGFEHNGADVEAVYGCDGWSLGERDLCPAHAPPQDEGRPDRTRTGM